MDQTLKDCLDSVTTKTSPALDQAMTYLKITDEAATLAAAAYLERPNVETRAELAKQVERAAWWRMTARKLNATVMKAA